MQNDTANFGNVWQFFRKLNIQHNNPIPRYLLNRNKNMHLHSNMNSNVYRNFILHCQNLETTQVSETDEQTVVHSYNVIQNCNKKEQITDIVNSMDET